MDKLNGLVFIVITSFLTTFLQERFDLQEQVHGVEQFELINAINFLFILLFLYALELYDHPQGFRGYSLTWHIPFENCDTT